MALQYLLSEAQKSFDLLCKLHPELERRAHGDLKSGVKYMDLSDLGTCCAALHERTITLVSKMFDTNHGRNKENISFRTEPWFVKNSAAKKIVDEVYSSAIIQKIRNSRNTWNAHMGRKQTEILSRTDLCDSDIRTQLDRLDNLLSVYTIWFVDTRGWENL